MIKININNIEEFYKKSEFYKSLDKTDTTDKTDTIGATNTENTENTIDIDNNLYMENIENFIVQNEQDFIDAVRIYNFWIFEEIPKYIHFDNSGDWALPAFVFQNPGYF